MRKVFPECKDVTLEEVYKDLQFVAHLERPYVAINMVSTVDGRTTAGGRMQQTPIGSRADRELMGWVRHAADIVVRGAQTVRANPSYPGVADNLVAIRRQKGMADQPLAAIITQTGNLPYDAPIFAEGPRRPVVIACSATPVEALERLRERAHVLVVGQDQVDVSEALQRLRTDFGVQSVLLEGGPTLNYHFLRRGLVDELFWTVAPKMIGGKAELSMVEGKDPFDPWVQLKLLSAYTFKDELFLRYRVL